jgi:hypothetical protein
MAKATKKTSKKKPAAKKKPAKKKASTKTAKRKPAAKKASKKATKKKADPTPRPGLFDKAEPATPRHVTGAAPAAPPKKDKPAATVGAKRTASSRSKNEHASKPAPSLRRRAGRRTIS